MTELRVDQSVIKPILCYGCEIYGAENYAIIETFHLKFMKHILDVKSSTNSVMVYAETGRYPLAIYVNMCMIKFWFKILNSHIHKLIHIVYQHLLHQPCMGEWLSPGAYPGFGRGGGQEIFFSDLGICMSRSDMLRMAKPCALLGGFGGMLPRENFLKRCNLVRFRVYFDQIFSLFYSKKCHFLYKK